MVLLALGLLGFGIGRNAPKEGFSLGYRSKWRISSTIYEYAVSIPIIWIAGVLATGTMSAIMMGVQFSQPFASMYQKDVSVADSLLLDYVWGFPSTVIAQAILNKHWKVAWFSIFGTIAPIFPTLVANLLTTVESEEELMFKGGAATYYVVFGFLVLFFITLLLAWPPEARRLPRWSPSLADLMSLFYASKLMDNPALDISDADASKRHLESRLFLQERRFEAGIFTGRDGKKHFGVDYKWDDDQTRQRIMVARVGDIEKTENGVLVHEVRDSV